MPLCIWQPIVMPLPECKLSTCETTNGCVKIVHSIIIMGPSCNVRNNVIYIHRRDELYMHLPSWDLGLITLFEYKASSLHQWMNNFLWTHYRIDMQVHCCELSDIYTLGKRNAFLVIVSPKKWSKRFLGEPKWRFLGDCFWESQASSYFNRYKYRHMRGDWKNHCLHWVATDVVNTRVSTFDCTFSFERCICDPREMRLHVTAACIAKWPICVYMVC